MLRNRNVDERKRTGENHPFVSEANEGKPWFEWSVAVLVVISALLALFGQVMWATIVLAASSIAASTVRLLLRDGSPWKIRSMGFDCFFGYALGIGLLVTYFSIRML